MSLSNQQFIPVNIFRLMKAIEKAEDGHGIRSDKGNFVEVEVDGKKVITLIINGNKYRIYSDTDVVPKAKPNPNKSISYKPTLLERIDGFIEKIKAWLQEEWI